MIAVIQRVLESAVTIEGKINGYKVSSYTNDR